jgi:hypothetical protein
MFPIANIDLKWLNDNNFRSLHLGVVYPTYIHKEEFKYDKIQHDTINNKFRCILNKNITVINSLEDLKRK